jgi:long-chain acyl-CoA synthetase
MIVSAAQFSPAETLPQLLLARAAEHGNNPAYYDKHKGLWRSHSWRQVADRTAMLAAALARRGIGEGDVVALIGNRPALVWAMVAAQSLGALPLLLAPELPPETMEDALASRQVRAAFVDGLHEVATIGALRLRLPRLNLVIHDDEGGLRQRRETWLVSYAAFTTEDPVPPLSPAVGPQDIAFIAMGVGEEATRTVQFRHAAAIADARVAASVGGAHIQDRMFGALPLSWSDGLILHQIQSLLVGFPLVYLSDGTMVLHDLRDASPTLLFGPPRFYRRLQEEIGSRTATGGSWRRRLFEPSPKAASAGLLGRWFWTDPVKDHFGLSRVRSALSVGGAPAPNVARFFASLGITIRDLDRAREPVAVQTPSSDRNVDDSRLSMAHEAA